ncbi:MAG: lipoxygenase family protein [Planctomycetota bacterium]
MSQIELPQRVSKDEQRSRLHELRRARSIYRYDAETLPGFVIAAEVPVSERYSVEYHSAIVDSVASVGGSLAGGPSMPANQRFATSSDFAALFGTLPRPSQLIDNYWRDWVFAEQRLAGPNPLVIERLTDLRALRKRMPLTDEHLQAALPMASTDVCGGVERAVDEGRLFIADYAVLEGIPAGTWREGRKYLCAPIAIFTWRSTGIGDRGELVPIAIQLHQGSGEGPIYTPSHDRWRAAKTFLQVADANHHEMIGHLAHTHLAMEPFAIATARQLSIDHPIRRLLAPHLQFLLARNAEARMRLLRPDGPVDNLLAGTLAGSLEIARRGRMGWGIPSATATDGSLPAWGLVSSAFERDLVRRGVADAELLPHYPYRDDGRLVMGAVTDFVGAYVALTYSSERDLAEDQELQDWARELARPGPAGGGGVRQMPPEIASRDELTRVLSEVIFTSGPKHAATNFPQLEYMGFVPNMPLAAYHPPPGSEPSALGEAEELRLTLPPAGQATMQLQIMFQLASYRHDRLGDYAGFEFAPAAQPLIRAFQVALRDVDERIRARNARRRVPYSHLMPALIPNSTSV